MVFWCVVLTNYTYGRYKYMKSSVSDIILIDKAIAQKYMGYLYAP